MTKLIWKPIPLSEFFAPQDPEPFTGLRETHPFNSVRFRIWYSGHFVTELTRDGHDPDTDQRERLAVLRSVRESQVYQTIIAAIEKTLDGIAVRASKSPSAEFQVVIQSEWLYLNMAVVVLPESDATTLTMKNVMFKHPDEYKTTSPRIRVNPLAKLLFAVEVDPFLEALVTEELRRTYEALEQGWTYDLEGDGFQFTVSVEPRALIIEDASWASKTYFVEVDE